MSALGGIPGFTYPALGYGDTELAQFPQSPQTFSGVGTFTVTLAKAAGDAAIFIRDVAVVYVATAAAATRRLDLRILDGDGNTVTQHTNPLTAVANDQNRNAWSSAVASPYTISSFGMSPLPQEVMPSGWSMVIAVFAAQAGDMITAISAIGIRIPTLQTTAPLPPAVPTPLLT